MFSDNIAVKVIHVMRISRSRRVSFPTTGRDFSVLSYRKTGETVFYQAGRAYEANGKSIAFIPQNLSYSQVSGNEDLIAVHFKFMGVFRIQSPCSVRKAAMHMSHYLKKF